VGDEEPTHQPGHGALLGLSHAAIIGARPPRASLTRCGAPEAARREDKLLILLISWKFSTTWRFHKPLWCLCADSTG